MTKEVKPFRFSGMLIDAKTGDIWSMVITNKRILMLPKHVSDKTKAESGLRFYRFIVENIDPNAEVKEVKR